MDDTIVVSHRVLRRVSLAVLLIDDLTGLAITGSNARAWIENEKPPVKKNDGWFVFTDLCEDEYTVFAEGGHYQKQSIICSTAGHSLRMHTMRLKPSKTYRLPYGCLRIEGKAEPFSKITVYSPDKQSALKLLSDAKADSSGLIIFHGDNSSLEGASFRIINPGSYSESINITESVPGNENAYRLAKPLENDYPRVGTMIVPAAETVSDDNGSFFLVLKASSSRAGIICESKGSRTVIKEYERTDSGHICPVLDE